MEPLPVSPTLYVRRSSIESASTEEESRKELPDVTMEDIYAILAKLPQQHLTDGQSLQISQFFLAYLGINPSLGQGSPLDSDNFKQREIELLNLALEFYLKENIEAAQIIGRCLTSCGSEPKRYYEVDHYFCGHCSQPGMQFIESITKRATDGDKVARFALGKMYLDRKDMAKDTQKAIDYFQLSANQGYPPAINAIGELLKLHYPPKNKSEPFDIKDALSFFKKIAKDNRDAMFMLGEMYLAANDESNAIDYFEMADEAQHPQAPFQLVVLYTLKYQNCAIKFFSKSILNKVTKYDSKCMHLKANNGDIGARLALGKLYLSGTSPLCPKDNKKSEHYLKLAADGGDGEAAYILFEQYSSSNFPSQDRGELASRYFALAAEKGHPLAFLEQMAIEGRFEAAHALYEFYDKGDASLSILPNKQKAESYLLMVAHMQNVQGIKLVLRLSEEGKFQSEFPVEEFKEQLNVAIEQQVVEMGIAAIDAAKRPGNSLNPVDHHEDL